MVFRIEMLPAGKGDCLWITYGASADKLRSVLIDGGVGATAPALAARTAVAGPDHTHELVVVTHVDHDHIGGLLALMRQDPSPIRCRDVWFNSHDHLLRAAELLAPWEGDALTELLVAGVAAKRFTWNGAFGGGPVVVPPDGPLPRVELAGGLVLTLLSPSPAKARAMAKVWVKETGDAGLRLGPGGLDALADANEELGDRGPAVIDDDTDLVALAARQRTLPAGSDKSAANGSSIAFLAEYDGKRVLFGADAHHKVLAAALNRLDPDYAVALDAFKLPHHGSRNNVSSELLGQVECPLYLFSTNGDDHFHPDAEAVAAVITEARRETIDPVTLAFNHDNACTATWKNAAQRARHGYAVRYPEAAAGGLVIEL